MKQFDLVLKNEKEKSYKSISILLLILNLPGILFITYLKGFTGWGPLIIAAAAVFLAFSFYYFKNRNEKAALTAAFFLLSLAWVTADYWPVAALNILLLLINKVVLETPIVSINENQITYPSFPKRKIGWNELTNLMLKDGLLTIDFKNNNLIQQNIAETSSTIDEKEFNEFCSLQLNK